MSQKKKSKSSRPQSLAVVAVGHSGSKQFRTEFMAVCIDLDRQVAWRLSAECVNWNFKHLRSHKPQGEERKGENWQQPVESPRSKVTAKEMTLWGVNDTQHSGHNSSSCGLLWAISGFTFRSHY